VEKSVQTFLFRKGSDSFRPVYFNYLPKEEFKATVTLRKGLWFLHHESCSFDFFPESLKNTIEFVLAEIRTINFLIG